MQVECFWIMEISACTLVTPPPPYDHLHVLKVIHKFKEREIQILRTKETSFLMAVIRFDNFFCVCVTVWVGAKCFSQHTLVVF